MKNGNHLRKPRLVSYFAVPSDAVAIRGYVLYRDPLLHMVCISLLQYHSRVVRPTVQCSWEGFRCAPLFRV